MDEEKEVEEREVVGTLLLELKERVVIAEESVVDDNKIQAVEATAQVEFSKVEDEEGAEEEIDAVGTAAVDDEAEVE